MAKVLVVEDDPAILANLSRFLRLEGFEVVAAANGAEGLRAVSKHRPDLVVSDLRMPEMDGETLLGALRTDPLYARLPVIFLTASADRAERDAKLKLGASDYLVKPLDLQELLAAVRKHLPPAPAA
jgi:DNA-binding response OmpR family regulator